MIEIKFLYGKYYKECANYFKFNYCKIGNSYNGIVENLDKDYIIKKYDKTMKIVFDIFGDNLKKIDPNKINELLELKDYDIQICFIDKDLSNISDKLNMFKCDIKLINSEKFKTKDDANISRNYVIYGPSNSGKTTCLNQLISNKFKDYTIIKQYTGYNFKHNVELYEHNDKSNDKTLFVLDDIIINEAYIEFIKKVDNSDTSIIVATQNPKSLIDSGFRANYVYTNFSNLKNNLLPNTTYVSDNDFNINEFNNYYIEKITKNKIYNVSECLDDYIKHNSKIIHISRHNNKSNKLDDEIIKDIKLYDNKCILYDIDNIKDNQIKLLIENNFNVYMEDM